MSNDRPEAETITCPCGCTVKFNEFNASNIGRFDKPCEEHKQLQAFDQIRKIQEAEQIRAKTKT